MHWTQKLHEPQGNDTDSDVTFITETEQGSWQKRWLIDSGVLWDMAKQNDWLFNYEQLCNKEQVTLGDGKTVEELG